MKVNVILAHVCYCRIVGCAALYISVLPLPPSLSSPLHQTGPAALEAIANGAVFLNPKFTPPHGRGNTEFFLGKPTSRNLTSQHPYAEEFVNKSAVVTVDIGDLSAVKEAVKRIVNSEVLFS